MIRSWISAVALAVLAVPVAAQDPPTPPTPPARPAPMRLVRTESLLGEIEGALRMRERLALSEEQLGRLEALRSEEVQRRLDVEQERAELRSRQRAGYDDADLRVRLEQLRTADRDAAEQRRARLDELLTETQREQLRSRSFRAAPRARSGGQPRASARSAPAPRAPRAVRPRAARVPRAVRPPAPSAPRAAPARGRMEFRRQQLAPAAPFLRRMPGARVAPGLVVPRVWRRGWL